MLLGQVPIRPALALLNCCATGRNPVEENFAMRRLIGCAVAVMFIVLSALPAVVGEIWTFYTGEADLNAPEPFLTLYGAGVT